MVMKDEFKNKFLNIDFDQILIDNDCKFVNYKEYIETKNTYLDKTKENVKLYEELHCCFCELNDNFVIKDNKKFQYTCIDKTKLCNVNKRLKDIVIKQTSLFKNMTDYISLLISIKK